VGKQSRKNAKLSARAEPRHGVTEQGRRLWPAIAAGVVVVLLVGLVALAISIANRPSTVGSGSGSGSGSLPPGTQTFDEPNHSHVAGLVTYDRVPPAGGPHNAVQLNCGIYTQPVPKENAVHSLEHGAVWITYRPTLAADEIAILTKLVSSNYVGTEKYLVLSPYAGIPSPIVASAWGAQLGVDQASDPRLADFIHYYAGGGQGGERGAQCTGGVGTPAG
jgi:hypothetical protein